MKAKLLKTAKGHYVLVDETKETYDKGFIIGNSRETMETYVKGFIIGTSRVNKLSLNNCLEIENGYDLSNLFCEVDESIDYQEFDFTSFRLGFQKALEFLNKKFGEEDMYKMFIYGDSIITAKKHVNTIKNKPLDEFFNDFIQSLQQTEWNVEIVADIYKDELANLDWFTNFVYGSLSMIGYEFYTEDLGICIVEGIEHPDYPGGTFIKTNKGKVEWNYQNNKTIFVGEDKFRPKLDKDGCLILKSL